MYEKLSMDILKWGDFGLTPEELKTGKIPPTSEFLETLEKVFKGKREEIIQNDMARGKTPKSIAEEKFFYGDAYKRLKKDIIDMWGDLRVAAHREHAGVSNIVREKLDKVDAIIEQLSSKIDVLRESQKLSDINVHFFDTTIKDVQAILKEPAIKELLAKRRSKTKGEVPGDEEGYEGEEAEEGAPESAVEASVDYDSLVEASGGTGPTIKTRKENYQSYLKDIHKGLEALIKDIRKLHDDGIPSEDADEGRARERSVLDRPVTEAGPEVSRQKKLLLEELVEKVRDNLEGIQKVVKDEKYFIEHKVLDAFPKMTDDLKAEHLNRFKRTHPGLSDKAYEELVKSEETDLEQIEKDVEKALNNFMGPKVSESEKSRIHNEEIKRIEQEQAKLPPGSVKPKEVLHVPERHILPVRKFVDFHYSEHPEVFKEMLKDLKKVVYDIQKIIKRRMDKDFVPPMPDPKNLLTKRYKEIIKELGDLEKLESEVERGTKTKDIKLFPQAGPGRKTEGLTVLEHADTLRKREIDRIKDSLSRNSEGLEVKKAWENLLAKFEKSNPTPDVKTVMKMMKDTIDEYKGGGEIAFMSALKKINKFVNDEWTPGIKERYKTYLSLLKKTVGTSGEGGFGIIEMLEKELKALQDLDLSNPSDLKKFLSQHYDKRMKDISEQVEWSRETPDIGLPGGHVLDPLTGIIKENPDKILSMAKKVIQKGIGGVQHDKAVQLMHHVLGKYRDDLTDARRIFIEEKARLEGMMKHIGPSTHKEIEKKEPVYNKIIDQILDDKQLWREVLQIPEFETRKVQVPETHEYSYANKKLIEFFKNMGDPRSSKLDPESWKERPESEWPHTIQGDIIELSFHNPSSYFKAKRVLEEKNIPCKPIDHIRSIEIPKKNSDKIVDLLKSNEVEDFAEKTYKSLQEEKPMTYETHTGRPRKEPGMKTAAKLLPVNPPDWKYKEDIENPFEPMLYRAITGLQNLKKQSLAAMTEAFSSKGHEIPAQAIRSDTIEKILSPMGSTQAEMDEDILRLHPIYMKLPEIFKRLYEYFSKNIRDEFTRGYQDEHFPNWKKNEYFPGGSKKGAEKKEKDFIDHLGAVIATISNYLKLLESSELTGSREDLEKYLKQDDNFNDLMGALSKAFGDLKSKIKTFDTYMSDYMAKRRQHKLAEVRSVVSFMRDMARDMLAVEVTTKPQTLDEAIKDVKAPGSPSWGGKSLGPGKTENEAELWLEEYDDYVKGYNKKYTSLLKFIQQKPGGGKKTWSYFPASFVSQEFLKDWKTESAAAGSKTLDVDVLGTVMKKKTDEYMDKSVKRQFSGDALRKEQKVTKELLEAINKRLLDGNELKKAIMNGGKNALTRYEEAIEQSGAKADEDKVKQAMEEIRQLKKTWDKYNGHVKLPPNVGNRLTGLQDIVNKFRKSDVKVVDPFAIESKGEGFITRPKVPLSVITEKASKIFDGIENNVIRVMNAIKWLQDQEYHLKHILGDIEEWLGEDGEPKVPEDEKQHSKAMFLPYMWKEIDELWMGRGKIPEFQRTYNLNLESYWKIYNKFNEITGMTLKSRLIGRLIQGLKDEIRANRDVKWFTNDGFKQEADGTIKIIPGQTSQEHINSLKDMLKKILGKGGMSVSEEQDIESHPDVVFNRILDLGEKQRELSKGDKKDFFEQKEPEEEKMAFNFPKPTDPVKLAMNVALKFAGLHDMEELAEVDLVTR